MSDRKSENITVAKVLLHKRAMRHEKSIKTKHITICVPQSRTINHVTSTYVRNVKTEKCFGALIGNQLFVLWVSSHCTMLPLRFLWSILRKITREKVRNALNNG